MVNWDTTNDRRLLLLALKVSSHTFVANISNSTVLSITMFLPKNSDMRLGKVLLSMSCAFEFLNSKDSMQKLALSPKSNLEESPKVIIYLTRLTVDLKSKKDGKSDSKREDTVKEEENVYDLSPMKVKKEKKEE